MSLCVTASTQTKKTQQEKIIVDWDKSRADKSNSELQRLKNKADTTLPQPETTYDTTPFETTPTPQETTTSTTPDATPTTEYETTTTTTTITTTTTTIATTTSDPFGDCDYVETVRGLHACSCYNFSLSLLATDGSFYGQTDSVVATTGITDQGLFY
jgi:hypothetical protein